MQLLSQGISRTRFVLLSCPVHHKFLRQVSVMLFALLLLLRLFRSEFHCMSSSEFHFSILPERSHRMTYTDPFASQMKQRGSYNGRSMTHMPVSIDAAATSYLGGWADAYNYSPGYSGYSSSTSGYTSPLPGPQEYPNVFSQAPLSHGYHRTRTSSDASFIEPWSHPSRSPTSTASTMAYWSSHEKTPTASGLAYIGASFPMTSMSMSTCVDPMTSYESLGPRSMAQRDDEEGVILFGEQAYGMGSITHTYPFEQYLDYFWRLFHPAFPIIHRPTFEHMNVPPILHAAMIATGGQYSNDISVKRKSRILHDRCIKLLERVSLDLQGTSSVR